MDKYMDQVTEQDFREFSDLSITDCHTHVHSVDEIFRIAYNESIYRVDQFNVLAINSARSRASNAMTLLFKRLFPRRVFGYASLQHPPEGVPANPEEFLRQAMRCKAQGFDGMKMLEGKPNTRKRIGVRLDDPVYDAYFDFLQREGMPILYHVNDPGIFWDKDRAPRVALERGWAYLDGSFRTKEELYGEVEGFLRKFPGLRIIFAHFYFMDEEGVERAGDFLDRWPQVSYDLTPGMHFKSFEANLEGWRDFIIKYQDRILFGTDNDYGMSRQLIYAMRSILETDNTIDCWDMRLRGMKLERAVLEKIYTRNFARYSGETPREVSPEDIAEECVHIEAIAGVGPEREGVLKDVADIRMQLRQRWMPGL